VVASAPFSFRYGLYVFIGLFNGLMMFDILQPGCPRAYVWITVAVVVVVDLACSVPLVFVPATVNSLFLLVPFFVAFLSSGVCYCIYVWAWSDEREKLRIKDAFSLKPGNPSAAQDFSPEPAEIRRDPNLNLPRPPTYRDFTTRQLEGFGEMDLQLSHLGGGERPVNHGDDGEGGVEEEEAAARGERLGLLAVAEHTEDRVNFWDMHREIISQHASERLVDPDGEEQGESEVSVMSPELVRRFKAIKRLVRASWTHRLSSFLYEIEAATSDEGKQEYKLLGASAHNWTLFDQDINPDSVQLSFRVVFDLLLFKLGILLTWISIQAYMTYVVRPIPPAAILLFMASAVGFLLLRAIVMMLLSGLNARLPHWPEIRFYAMFAGQMYFELAYRSFFLFAGNWTITLSLAALTFCVTLFQYGVQISKWWFELFHVSCRRHPFCRFTQFCFMDPERQGFALSFETHIANKSIRYFWSNISKSFSLLAFVIMFAILHYTPWLKHFYPTLRLDPRRVEDTLYTYLFLGGFEIFTDFIVTLISRFYLRVDMSFHAKIATILDTRTRFLFAVTLLLVYMDTPISLVRFVL
ncbi:MAG: hypothetical protein Q8P67_09065, partial [archaeon]|nr:hypothetical protein [archaeon]